MEQDVLTEVPDIMNALFLWFCVHYVFDMEYGNLVTSVGHMFQDMIVNIPGSAPRKASYKSIIGDIKVHSQGRLQFLLHNLSC